MKTIIRRCVACRESKPRSELRRITLNKALGQFSVDNNPPLQGRSAYVCPKPACIQAATHGKKLQKALKCAIPGDIVGTLVQALS